MGASLDAKLGFRGLQHLVADAQSAVRGHHEEFIDLGGEALMLEAEDVHGEQVSRRLPIHHGQPRAPEIRVFQYARKQRTHAARVETCDGVEAPVLFDHRQQCVDIGRDGRLYSDCLRHVVSP
jgi:hypothetical protein